MSNLKRVIIAADSFPVSYGEDTTFYDFMRREDAATYIAGIKIATPMFLDHHRAEIVMPFFRTYGYDMVADIDLAGSHENMEAELNRIRSAWPAAKQKIILGQGIAQDGIEFLQDEFGDEGIDFLLTGVLPENNPDTFGRGHNGLSVDEFTADRVGFATDMEILGVYGSAVMSKHSIPGQHYLGSGVSLTGEGYTVQDVIGGRKTQINKVATTVDEALVHCDAIVVGHALFRNGASINENFDAICEKIEQAA